MNKFFNTLCLGFSFLAVGLLTTACSEQKLDEIVSSAAQSCPMDLGKMGKVTNVAQNDTAVVFTITVQEDSISIDSIKSQQSEAEKLIRALLSVPDGDTKELLSVMVAQKKGLQYVFVGDKSAKTSSMGVTAKRLSQLVDPNGKAIDNPERRIRKNATDTLQNMLVQARKILPQKVGNGIVVEKIEIEGAYIVYHCLLDGTGLTIDKIEGNAAQVKKDMIKILPKMGDISRVCIEGNLGLIYRYHTPKPAKDSKERQKSFGIVITPAEMGK